MNEETRTVVWVLGLTLVVVVFAGGMGIMLLDTAERRALFRKIRRRRKKLKVVCRD